MSASPSHNQVIAVRGLDKSFGDGHARRQVLHGIDLSARDSELMMLVGPSGCGKTTLLSLVAGTLAPDAGEIEVFGEKLHTLSGRALTAFRARHIGFIFQQFNLIPTLTCAENASVPLLIQGVRPGAAEKKAREWLGRVGLGDRAKSRPSQLSGGQQQRVAIARALVHEPQLIICDEPTASLDAQNGTVVMDIFREYTRQPGRATLVVTHDNRIFKYADRIAQMDDGRIVEVHDVTDASPPPGITTH
jgi:putative ABC transport system ATP-binding protein